jgi:Flp pilus assembly protein TadD
MTLSCRRPLPWRYVLLLGLAVIGAYWNSLAGPFTFDDQVSVLQNTQIRHLWPLWDALSPPGGGWPVSGRPLVNLSLAVNYAIGNLNVRGYHVANIGIHLACTLLLFGLIRRTPATAAGLTRGPARITDHLAFICALLWAIHPLQTETIDYISKRSELMMSLCYLLTIYGSLRAAGAARQGGWFAISVVASAMGMACKETMVTAPLMVVLYDSTFLFGSLRAAVNRRLTFYAALFSTWSLLGVLMWNSPRAETAGVSTPAASWTYLLNQAEMIVRYLWLAMWPGALVLDYGEPRIVTLRAVAPEAALLVFLAIVVVFALRRDRAVGFLGAWFFIVLAPTSSIVPVATEVGAESRMYLPLVALVCALVIGGDLLRVRLEERTNRGKWRVLSLRVGTGVGMILVAAVLTTGTWRRNHEYRSTVTLWRTVVDRWPHARAHRNLASALKDANRPEEALVQLRDAVHEQPAARYALGQELLNQGQVEAAIEELRQATLELPGDPNVLSARTLMGRAFASRGRYPEAIQEFQAVLQAAPADAVARGGLADALFAQKRFNAASAAYREYLKAKPDNAPAWHYLGVALFRSGDKTGAVSALQQAVTLQPDDGRMQGNLARVLLDLHDVDGAVTHAALAVRLLPDDADARVTFAAALSYRDALRR